MIPTLGGTIGGFGQSGGDQSFASVVLLLGFEGTNGATATSDESSAAHGAGTFVGNAQISTSQLKFGVSSLLLDGTGDYVSWPDNADWDLSDANSDQFTVEAWIRPASVTGGCIVGQDDGSGNMGWVFWINVGQLTIYYSPSGTYGGIVGLSSPTLLSANNWYHVAMDKDATGKLRSYIDGAMVAHSTPGDSSFFNSTALLKIGRSAAVGDFNGYIDELRITKGVARYASDSGYTVPTAAFPRS